MGHATLSSQSRPAVLRFTFARIAPAVLLLLCIGCTPGGSFEGEVIDWRSREPISNVHIEVSTPTGDISRDPYAYFEVITDETGSYEIEGVQPFRPYTVTVSKSEYATYSFTAPPVQDGKTIPLEEVALVPAPPRPGIYILEEYGFRELGLDAASVSTTIDPAEDNSTAELSLSEEAQLSATLISVGSDSILLAVPGDARESNVYWVDRTGDKTLLLEEVSETTLLEDWLVSGGMFRFLKLFLNPGESVFVSDSYAPLDPEADEDATPYARTGYVLTAISADDNQEALQSDHNLRLAGIALSENRLESAEHYLDAVDVERSPEEHGALHEDLSARRTEEREHLDKLRDSDLGLIELLDVMGEMKAVNAEAEIPELIPSETFHIINEPKAYPADFRLSEDGRYVGVVVAKNDAKHGEVRFALLIWDIETHETVLTIRQNVDSGHQIFDFEIAPDSNSVVLVRSTGNFQTDYIEMHGLNGQLQWSYPFTGNVVASRLADAGLQQTRPTAIAYVNDGDEVLVTLRSQSTHSDGGAREGILILESETGNDLEAYSMEKLGGAQDVTVDASSSEIVVLGSGRYRGEQNAVATILDARTKQPEYFLASDSAVRSIRSSGGVTCTGTASGTIDIFDRNRSSGTYRNATRHIEVAGKNATIARITVGGDSSSEYAAVVIDDAMLGRDAKIYRLPDWEPAIEVGKWRGTGFITRDGQALYAIGARSQSGVIIWKYGPEQ